MKSASQPVLLTLFVILFVFFLCHPVQAQFDPEDLTDRTGDGNIQVGLIGDSFVYGVGDEDNGGIGGYVARFQQGYPQLAVSSYGVPGLTTQQLLGELNDLSNHPELRAVVMNSDYLSVHIGVNDYYVHNSPTITFQTLVESVHRITQYIHDNRGYGIPFLAVGTLPPARTDQSDFILNLNDLLLNSSSALLHADVYFQNLSVDLIGQDDLHPTSEGYDELTSFLIGYFSNIDHEAITADADQDGMPDIYDLCAGMDDFLDTDQDLVPDGCDECPNNSELTLSSVCGCSVAGGDSDGDSIPDCMDPCPADASKNQPGVCGCGINDSDSDSDGILDCQDECPNNGYKTSPGVCGCDYMDFDSDFDLVPLCIDDCPYDPNKATPGVCGCNKPDVDLNNNNIMDCFFRDDLSLEISILFERVRKRRRLSFRVIQQSTDAISSLYKQYDNLFFAESNTKKLLSATRKLIKILKSSVRARRIFRANRTEIKLRARKAKQLLKKPE